MFTWHKIHISTVKQKRHTGNKDYSSHLQNGNTVCQKLSAEKESWQTSYSTSALKADLARCGDWIVKNCIMRTELNFFNRMGENDTGAHTILVARVKKKKQKNLLCWRAINHVWRCWKKSNSNTPWRAVSYHLKRGLRGDLRKTSTYIHGRKATGNTEYLNLEKKEITWASA